MIEDQPQVACHRGAKPPAVRTANRQGRTRIRSERRGGSSVHVYAITQDSLLPNQVAAFPPHLGEQFQSVPSPSRGARSCYTFSIVEFNGERLSCTCQLGQR